MFSLCFFVSSTSPVFTYFRLIFSCPRFRPTWSFSPTSWGQAWLILTAHWLFPPGSSSSFLRSNNGPKACNQNCSNNTYSSQASWVPTEVGYYAARETVSHQNSSNNMLATLASHPPIVARQTRALQATGQPGRPRIIEIVQTKS